MPASDASDEGFVPVKQSLHPLKLNLQCQDIAEDAKDDDCQAFLDNGTLGEVLARYIKHRQKASPNLLGAELIVIKGTPSSKSLDGTQLTAVLQESRIDLRWLNFKSLTVSQIFCHAEALSRKALDELSGKEHQTLLAFLCDEVLDREAMRDALQERLEGSGDVKREMREAVAEKKGELKVSILGSCFLLNSKS